MRVVHAWPNHQVAATNFTTRRYVSMPVLRHIHRTSRSRTIPRLRPQAPARSSTMSTTAIGRPCPMMRPSGCGGGSTWPTVPVRSGASYGRFGDLLIDAEQRAACPVGVILVVNDMVAAVRRPRLSEA
jgi:hypothetical protein